MKRSTVRRVTLSAVLFTVTFAAAALVAQESSPSSAPAQPQPNSPTAQGVSQQSDTSESGGAGPNGGIGEILGATTEQAAHRSEVWGKKIGLSGDTSFAISLAVNFAGILLFFYLVLKSKLPQMFRDRTSSIQKAIRDAQAASADATQRLRNVEARLAKLDSEVSGIRAEAEKQAVAEEERIRAAAEEDKRRVVESAKLEIDAIARNARRDLKNYASSLAVDIAAKRIHVDENTDRALFREFVDQLGKDGH